MPRLEPVAVVLVDLMAMRGLCSYCNQPAKIPVKFTNRYHTCGVRVLAVAVNAMYAAGPTPDVRLVVASIPRYLIFAGVGRIAPNSAGGWRFESVMSPSGLV